MKKTEKLNLANRAKQAYGTGLERHKQVMGMSTVKELLDDKGRNTWMINTDASVYDAVAMMAEKNVGALTVESSEKPLAGIISERDYARKIILKDRASKDTKVSEIMTANVITAQETTSLDKCMAVMIQNKIRHLPIVEDGRPVGIITLGDLMKTIIREQSEAIEELESYVFEDEGGEG